METVGCTNVLILQNVIFFFNALTLIDHQLKQRQMRLS